MTLKLQRVVEALIFASKEPIDELSLLQMVSIEQRVTIDSLQNVLANLQDEYKNRGVNLVKSGSSWAFRTAEDLRLLFCREEEKSRRLGRGILEVLAVIAWHQPVTRVEIEQIRGVATNKTFLRTLVELGWVRSAGRRAIAGRPTLWCTTDKFLDHFNLRSLDELPGLEEMRASGLLGEELKSYEAFGELKENVSLGDQFELSSIMEEEEDFSSPLIMEKVEINKINLDRYLAVDRDSDD